jgi:hypothetical protein
MQLPYGIDDQYIFFINFLKDVSNMNQTLHIQYYSYETPAILSIAIHDWEKELGSDTVQIKYIESDSHSKRVIVNKKTNQIKTILFDIDYTIDWVWKSYSQFTIVIR